MKARIGLLHKDGTLETITCQYVLNWTKTLAWLCDTYYTEDLVQSLLTTGGIVLTKFPLHYLESTSTMVDMATFVKDIKDKTINEDFVYLYMFQDKTWSVFENDLTLLNVWLVSTGKDAT